MTSSEPVNAMMPLGDEEESIDREVWIAMEDDMAHARPDGEELAAGAELAGDEIPNRTTGRFVVEDLLHGHDIDRLVDSPWRGGLTDHVHGSNDGPTRGVGVGRGATGAGRGGNPRRESLGGVSGRRHIIAVMPQKGKRRALFGRLVTDQRCPAMA